MELETEFRIRILISSRVREMGVCGMINEVSGIQNGCITNDNKSPNKTGALYFDS